MPRSPGKANLLLDENTLRLHSLILRMPDRESLPLLQEFSEDHRWMQAGLHELDLTPLAEWRGEYKRLFVDGIPDTPAPPYETVYRHQAMRGPVLEQLQNLYRDAGLSIGEQPADHLGTQLAFAAHLATSDDPRAEHWQTRLWREHLHHWLPRFTVDLCQHSRLLFYRLWGGQLNLLSAQMQERFAHA